MSQQAADAFVKRLVGGTKANAGIAQSLRSHAAYGPALFRNRYPLTNQSIDAVNDSMQNYPDPSGTRERAKQTVHKRSSKR